MEFFKISECSGKVFCFVISELFPYKLFWSDYLQWYLSWITNVIYHEIQSGRIKTITKHFHQNNMMPRSLFSVYNFCNRHLVCQKYVREMTCNNVFYFGFVDVRFVQLSLVQNWIVWWRKKKNNLYDVRYGCKWDFKLTDRTVVSMISNREQKKNTIVLNSC